MDDSLRFFVEDRYASQHGAQPVIGYQRWNSVQGSADQILATLAYRSAADERLFLEAYLTGPIEQAVSSALGRIIQRNSIVEIGCLAALPTAALLKLWLAVADTLSADYDVVVATLTRPLRRMLGRVGIELIELAPANPEKLDPKCSGHWGRYYDLDPVVCAGDISQGLRALSHFAGHEQAA